MVVLGIEGTAWAASAAVYDPDADPAFPAGDPGVDADRSTAGGHDPGDARPARSTPAGDPNPDAVAIETDAYQPESGGIDPGEAAEHMRSAVPRVLEAALTDHVPGDPADAVEAVAFSRGPGLGPCLRVVGTAARTLAARLDVPLVGVNHMLAHAEVGRHYAGFADPVCLNASGANAHVLAAVGDRYRVLGETMDTGVGNAIDKFARKLGWSHPGGPKVEARAREGEYHELPYVVKGMDFSFSGLSSAAAAAVEDGVPVADVCRGLEETVFGVLAEVSERALSLTGADELVLGGGVGQNDRLRSTLDAMCERRGARFFAPEARFLRDNAGMIAVLGARMARAGDTVAVADSRVRPDWRPDEVPVTWRPVGGLDRRGGGVGGRDRPDGAPGVDVGTETGAGAADGTVRGAEAVVTVERDGSAVGARGPVVRKRRPEKFYRHPELDCRVRRDRTVMEARLTALARRVGVPTPVVWDVDTRRAELVADRVGTVELRDVLRDEPDPAGVDPADRLRTVGAHLAALHDAGVVHGDPTPRNVRLGDGDGSGNDGDAPDRPAPDAPETLDADAGTDADADTDAGPVADEAGPGAGEAGTGRVPVAHTYLIDFGLGYHTDAVEDFAMDLHVLAGSLRGVVADPEPLVAAVEAGYREATLPAAPPDGPGGRIETGTVAGRRDRVFDRLRSIGRRGRYRDRSG